MSVGPPHRPRSDMEPEAWIPFVVLGVMFALVMAPFVILSIGSAVHGC